MALLLGGEIVVALMLQLVMCGWFFVIATKPNLVLVALLVFVARANPPFLFLFAGVAGVVLDVFSHGVLGMHALSLMVVCVLAGALCERADYDGLIMPSLLVFLCSLLYGWLGIGLHHWALQGTGNWVGVALLQVPLSAFYNLLLAPFWIWGIGNLEKCLGYLPERNSIF